MTTTILRSGSEAGGFKGTCLGEVKAEDQRLTKQDAQRGPFLGTRADQVQEERGSFDK